jgi:hypothetical protein
MANTEIERKSRNFGPQVKMEERQRRSWINIVAMRLTPEYLRLQV